MLANLARLKQDMAEAKTTVTKVVGDINRTLSTIGVGISFAAVAGGIGTMVRAAEDAAIAQRKLDAVLKATGNTSGYTADQLSRLADQLARTSSFDDEAFREATATLLRFGNIGGANLEKVLKLSADYAALTGGDVVSAAEKLGRALSDPAEGLGKLERNFGSLGKETELAIKTQQQMGDQAGALAIAIEALQKKIGGSDQEMNQGLTGSMKQLRKAVNELMEAGGQAADNSFVVSVLDAITTRLRGIKAVMEGPWAYKLMAILGGDRVISALGNMPGAAITPGGGSSLPITTVVDEGLDSRGAANLRIMLERREAEKRARKEWLEEQEKMRKADLAGWVAYADAVFKEADDNNLAMAKIAEEFWANEERLRQDDLKGWVAYAEAVFKEADETNLAIAKATEERFKAEEGRWSGFMGGIESAFRDSWDAFTSGAKNAGEVAINALKRTFFDQLWQLFARPIVLNIVAGVGNSLGISGLGSAATLAGGGGGGLMGGLGGLFGSPLGMAVGGAGLAAMLYSAFNDGPENPNFRWMQGTGGQGLFGGIGTQGNYNFDSSGLMSYVGGLDARFARILGPSGSAAASAALAGYTNAGLRMDGLQPAQFAFPEGTDREAAEQLARELLQSRYGTLFDQIDSSIAEQIRGWSGSSTELQAFIETALGVVEGLSGLGVTGLNIATLQAMQREGEGLGDTFNRVAGQWSQFNDLFTTDAERLSSAQSLVTDTFRDLGIEVPKTMDGFEALVRGLDLSTEAGRKLFDALMDVAPAFASVQNAAANMMSNWQSAMTSYWGSAFTGPTNSAAQQAAAEAFMANNAWTQGYTWQQVAQILPNIGAADFANYSSEDQQLITDIINLGAALGQGSQGLAGAASGATSAINGMVDAIKQAKDGIAEWLDRVLLSDVSPLTPQERLDAAQQAYVENLMRAQAGDAGALAAFTGLADAYLREAQSYWASSPEYRAIFEAVTGQGGALAGLSDARPVNKGDADRNTERIVRELEGVRTEIRDLGNGTIALNRTTDRVVKAVDTLTKTTKTATERQTRDLITPLGV